MCEGKITQLHLEHIKQFTWWTILRGSLTSVHAQCPRIKWRLCGAQEQLWTYTFPGTTKTYRLQQTQTQTVFKSSALDTEPWLNNALHPQTKFHIMRNKNGKKTAFNLMHHTHTHTLSSSMTRTKKILITLGGLEVIMYTIWWPKIFMWNFLQCFDIVGWVTGMASSL